MIYFKTLKNYISNNFYILLDKFILSGILIFLWEKIKEFEIALALEAPSLKRLKLEIVKSTKKGQMTPILPILHPKHLKVYSHLTPFGASNSNESIPMSILKITQDHNSFYLNYTVKHGFWKAHQLVKI
ncbi:hypothetical protein BpHYR1_034642 [Brachionus plicatilis]|uniref:Uncharacterized protein n=1 Tax=Brachionus plicatilis TaxID=10195 RepID=A0A3M7R6Z1_BRAPC|nr:hypothetical protein BpHYR1_034642 [Brachionus plicatilis]